MTVRHSTVALLVALAAIPWASATRSQQPERVVAITIDDLPVSAVSVTSEWASMTDRLLAALRRHAAPAVGFVNESKLYTNATLDPTRVALLESWLAA